MIKLPPYGLQIKLFKSLVSNDFFCFYMRFVRIFRVNSIRKYLVKTCQKNSAKRNRKTKVCKRSDCYTSTSWKSRGLSLKKIYAKNFGTIFSVLLRSEKVQTNGKIVLHIPTSINSHICSGNVLCIVRS